MWKQSYGPYAKKQFDNDNCSYDDLYCCNQINNIWMDLLSIVQAMPMPVCPGI